MGDAHPTPDDLMAFDGGGLGDAERTAIEEHLSDCTRCQAVLETVPEDAFAATVRAYGQSDAHDLPPELVGHPRYRVLALLGAGGMGRVYKAIHLVLNRVVALKVLRPELVTRPDFAARFLTEARSVARLAHPNVATAFDADTVGATLFLVTEYIPGRTLEQIVREHGPLPVAEACAYIYQAALGLQHAHEQGLVHRDLKPSNLIVASLPTDRPVVKLLDFGLACCQAPASDTTDSTGVLLGTPDFLAPEQARAPDHAGVRADLYSLGATLYYLLAGRPLFPDATTLQKLLAHQERTPPAIGTIRPDVPVELAALLDRLLAKAPARRPASARDLADDLAPLAGLSRPVSAPRRRPLVLGLLVASVLAGALGSLVAFHERPAPVLVPAAADAAAGGLSSPPEPGPLLDTAGTEVLHSTLRDQTAAWVRANNAWGPEHTITRDVLRDVDNNRARIEGFQFIFSGKLLKSKQPTLFAARPGGTFAFPLNTTHTQALNLRDGTSRFFGYHKVTTDARRARPRVQLSDLRLDDSAALPINRKVRGSVTYERTDAAPWTSGVALRVLHYRQAQRVMGVVYLPPLPDRRGTLTFEAPALDRENGTLRGPVVLFVELATTGASRPIIESDAAAALVQVVEP